MSMDVRSIVEAVLLLLAWAASLAVRPWRLLRPYGGELPPLVTPFLACLTLLPWLWCLPGLTALPLPVHWSGAPLVALLLGWPLAVPVVTVAGLATMVVAGGSPAHALSLIVWAGVAPATAVLLLGHLVRKAFGPHPAAFLLGRAFLVPLLTLLACGFMAAASSHGLQGPTASLQRIAVVLLAMGEASWTCAVVSALVAGRPQWLATWSDRMYLRPPVRQPARTPLRPRR